MTIHLYTEHLVNIRTLALQASLSTVSNKETKATISADGKLLTFQHEGEAAKINLPAQIPGRRNVITLTVPAAPTKDMNFRFKLEEKQDEPGLLPNTQQDSTNIIPWSATLLSDDVEIACKTCDSIVVKRGKVKTWKDLPSENWAEMMDFWHCHRPDVPHDHDHQTPRKGYSADSRLALEQGVGMVDPVDFLLAAEDCESVCDENEELLCSTCQTLLGHVDGSSGGYKLRKMHVALSSDANSPSISHPVNKWFACHLLSSMDSQGVRKFLVQRTDHIGLAIECWVFTPDLNVSSSQAESLEPFRAVKVLWCECDATEDTGTLNREALSHGEVELPPSDFNLLKETLDVSAALLPESAREFQGWNVALLPRFQAFDIGQDAEGTKNASGDSGTAQVLPVRTVPQKVADVGAKQDGAFHLTKRHIKVVRDL